MKTRLKFFFVQLLSVAALVVGPAHLLAQQPPPPQPTPPAPTAVTISENDLGYTLDNGTIQALVSRKSGDLISMKYKGVEMLGTLMNPDGSFDLTTDPPGDYGRGMPAFGTDHMYGFWSHDTVADRSEAKVTIDPKTNGGERGEVSVKGFSDGKKLGHGPGSPNGDFAADIEIRYTLGRGESGVYTYCIFSHKPEYPNATMGEARFCVKLNNTFDWILINQKHNQMYPMELERDGDNKYNYTVVQWENPVFGWASFYKNTGFFIMNPSVEYLTGPPTKVEFLCHRDTSAPNYIPCILNYWRSSHYGGASVDVAQGESWTKVIGPFMLYCNNGNNPQAIFAEAQAQQKREAAKWPYDWVQGVDYPHKDQRATVSGQLVLTDSLAPAGTSVSNIRVGLAYPDYTATTGRAAATNAPSEVHWQVDAKHYEFWVRGDNDGTFAIPSVRPGTYTLHAIADGVLGEFAKTDVVVEAGKPLDLGKLTWTPVRRGRQLWDIGIPNRNGSEFAKGDDYFHDGMPIVYALLFPNDVSYTVGKSDFRHDWFYLQVPHAQEAAIEAATVNAQPRQPRIFTGARRGPTSFPGGRGAATQPGARGAGLGRGAGGFGARGARGAGGAPPAPAARATPWNVSFDMPSAVHGKATLRLGIASAGTRELDVTVNGKDAGRFTQLPPDSAIGRNGIQGIWFERELPFDASLLKPGENVLTLTVPAGGLTSGVIYDYLRLELDESAAAPTPAP